MMAFAELFFSSSFRNCSSSAVVILVWWSPLMLFSPDLLHEQWYARPIMMMLQRPYHSSMGHLSLRRITFVAAVQSLILQHFDTVSKFIQY